MIIKPSLNVPPWADSGDAIQPDSLYIASGFPHTNDKPTRQTMNWVLNYATNGVQYLTSRGIPDWDAGQSYTAGDVVRFQGRFYSALQSNNTNRQPATATAWWALWFVFQADLNALFITPAQVAALYMTSAQVAATYATITSLNTTNQSLQNQINAITAVTGTGYRGGNGISIDANNFIHNTSPNVNADWNAGVGTPEHILNKPTFAVVATSGSYNDLSNRPALAPVATSGRWQDLTEIPSFPPPQVNSDWSAGVGMPGYILNKPNIQIDDGTVVARGYRCRSALNGSFQSLNFNIAWSGGLSAQLILDDVNYGYITSVSDYRFKQNINIISSALPLVMRLRPVTFQWKEPADNVLHAGFLAHEVQEVFAGAAEGVKDATTADGKIQPQHLNDRDLIALLTKAVQELSARLSLLEDQHGIAN